jgi:hypothetical protein
MNIHRELFIYRHLCFRAHEALIALRECEDGSWEAEACNVVFVYLNRLARDKAVEIADAFDGDGQET